MDGGQHEWGSKVKRVVRRRIIDEVLHESHVNGGSVSSDVRNLERKRDVSAVVEGLIANEVNIEPKMGKLCDELSEQLRSTYDWLDGIVLMGSSVHGGAVVRGLVGHLEPDLDWGFVTNRPVGTSELRAAVEEGGKLLPRLSKGAEFVNDLVSCEYINPVSYSMVAQQTPEDYLSLLVDNSDFGTVDGFERRVALILQPSFPGEVNIQQRKVLFDALSTLSVSDHRVWNNAVMLIYREWMRIHEIKFKHFGIEFPGFGRKRTKDQTLVENVVDFSSRQAMGKSMLDTLKSTDKSVR